MSHYQRRNFKYELALDKWSELKPWEVREDYRLSFNLLPLIDNRFILVVSEDRPKLYDTQCNEWVNLEQTGQELRGVQIGAFTLPIASKLFNTKAKANEDKDNDQKTEKEESTE